MPIGLAQPLAIRPGHPLSYGLRACWVFADGGPVALDVLPGPVGSLNGGTPPRRSAFMWGAGLQGSNTSGSFVSVPHHRALDITGSSMTLIAWFDVSNTLATIVGKPHAATHTAPFFKYSFYFDNVGRFSFRLDSTEVITATGFFGQRAVPYMIAGTYDGTTMRIFVDGREENTAAKTGTVQSSTEALRMFANRDGGETNGGRLWQVMLYDVCVLPHGLRQLADDRFCFMRR